MTAFGVVGGGSFGRGLAAAIARGGNEPVLFSRRARTDLPDGVTATQDASELARCELIFFAVPSTYVPLLAPEIGAHLDGRHLIVHVSRGLIGEQLQTVCRHLVSTTPVRRVGCLAGPINPSVLLDAKPGGGIVGTGFPEVVESVREAIGGPTLRLYESRDVFGVEVASAMVGLLALAAGFARETNVSPAALAILINRGLAEAARVGAQLGAKPETFHGMAGAGDLFAVLAGDERAEVRLGRAMGSTKNWREAGKATGATIEGLSIARNVAGFAASIGEEAPISAILADVIGGELAPMLALQKLMER